MKQKFFSKKNIIDEKETFRYKKKFITIKRSEGVTQEVEVIKINK